MIENAQAEFGSDRIVIGGESAGGHLSALILLRMRDRHNFTGFAGANLVYGIFDLGMTPSVERGGEALAWTTPTHEYCVAQFAPAVDPRDPDLSPLHAELSALPPALFTVGTLDSLLDDSLFMHARWIAAGNDSKLALYPGGIHGFNVTGSPLAAEAVAMTA